MNIVKYRVFHEGEMIYPKELAIIKVYDNRDDYVYKVNYNLYVKADQLMMCTGLNDNGTDIYAGDILQGSGGAMFTVTWDSRDAKFMLLIHYDEDAEGIRKTHEPMPTDAFLLRIVGNIHEGVKKHGR